ncbi:MAG TPA: electron transfer flavoprotein subunit alpha/FixB family protein [Deltaproteobacteria bacterium]|nr:electron transfer flavoprotein subunit alpha/FixB family protein [Deltaproteobacteria bacterium]
MHTPVFIVAETKHGEVTAESLDLFGLAADIAKGPPEAVFMAAGHTSIAESFALMTGCTVHAVETGDPSRPVHADICRAVTEVLNGRDTFVVCLPGTSFGIDTAAVLSARLDAACVPGVESVHGGVFTRPVHGGRFLEDIVPGRSRVVCTASPGAWQAPSFPFGANASVIMHPAEQGERRIRLVETREPLHRDSTLKDADVIVAVGRGFGSKENIRLAHELASLFPRSAVGASRGACDLRWIDYTRQIGVTGQSVAPRLYIACGISGAVQHIAGMKGSQIVVAVNSDVDAAIFRIADVCIVEDVVTFLPVLIEEIRNRKT